MTHWCSIWESSCAPGLPPTPPPVSLWFVVQKVVPAEAAFVCLGSLRWYLWKLRNPRRLPGLGPRRHFRHRDTTLLAGAAPSGRPVGAVPPCAPACWVPGKGSRRGSCGRAEVLLWQGRSRWSPAAVPRRGTQGRLLQLLCLRGSRGSSRLLRPPGSAYQPRLLSEALPWALRGLGARWSRRSSRCLESRALAFAPGRVSCWTSSQTNRLQAPVKYGSLLTWTGTYLFDYISMNS